MPNSTYKIVEIVGTSKTSWEEAARAAVESAGESVADLRIAEVVQMDMTIANGKVVLFRVRVNLSFKYHGEKVISASYKKAKDISRIDVRTLGKRKGG